MLITVVVPREDDWGSDVGKNLTFYVVLFYIFLNFFLVRMFHFGNRTKSVVF